MDHVILMEIIQRVGRFGQLKSMQQVRSHEINRCASNKTRQSDAINFRVNRNVFDQGPVVDEGTHEIKVLVTFERS